MKLLVFFGGAFVLFSQALAQPYNTSLKISSVSKIQKIVDQFFHTNSGLLRHPDCEPNAPSCLEVACRRLSPFDCNENSEIEDLGKACRGNLNGNCLNAACNKLSPFDCNEPSEIKTLARACVGNRDGKCLDFTCEKLGPFACNELREVEKILQTCAGN